MIYTFFQTLNVVVDNCSDIKVCRVLDCDTITQVKEKCLTQIYFNYPASNLIVTPEELEIGKPILICDYCHWSQGTQIYVAILKIFKPHLLPNTE